MISRLTASAAVFAVLAAATMTFAAQAQQRHVAMARTAVVAAAPLEIIELPRVVITGRRAP